MEDREALKEMELIDEYEKHEEGARRARTYMTLTDLGLRFAETLAKGEDLLKGARR